MPVRHAPLAVVLATALVLCGLALAAGAIVLLTEGRASLELLAGPLLVASGVETFRGQRTGHHIFIAYFVVVWAASLCEVGFDGWSLLPRVDLACFFLPLFYVPAISRHFLPNRLSQLWQTWPSYRSAIGPGLLAILAVTVIGANMQAPKALPLSDRLPVVGEGDWPSFAGNPQSGKFSPLAEINTGNAHKLAVAWEHVEPAPSEGTQPPVRKDEVTPLQIGDKLYVCQPDNVVLALDAENGRQIWRFDPHADTHGLIAEICRGVAYYEDPRSSNCPKRLIMGTIDARLFAINAETGVPCTDFGSNGHIDLTAGMGVVKKGYYYVTSPPAIAKGLAIVGGLVKDNESVGEPSGVIRAFDARTGAFRWAWDLGNTRSPAQPLKGGEQYTRGTPNGWTLFSTDESLGLVFVPTGNATPDFVAQHRRPEWERYASALVALDLATGKPRWSFQTVHHDVWDYDLSAQPVLTDMTIANQIVPALIVASKRGDLFVLDRRDGHPLSPIEERAVPQSDVSGEISSPTQPAPIAALRLGGADLTDTDMWGISPFDRLFCRIAFHRLRYDGGFTPPSLRGSLEYPGVAGGVDWGGMSLDPGRHLLLVPTMHIAHRIRLFKRSDNDPRTNIPQLGTAYSANLVPFVTRLGIPCQRPPYAKLTAIDLVSQRIAWQKPLGTAEALGPMGIPSHLPFTLGAPPVVGGVITTAGDITFIGAVGDRRLRAIDSLSGGELWSTRLPEGNQATPITYRAPHSGRQMVVIVSGGSAGLGDSRRVATHVMAYALKP